MDWSLTQLAHEFLARLEHGPLHFRLILQPGVAIFLGIRDGLVDAKAGRQPFLLALLSQPGSRLAHLKAVLWRLRVPIVVAIAFDCLVQFLMFGHVRPMIALLFGTSLMAFPYSAARALSNRFHFWRLGRRGTIGQPHPAARGRR